MQMPQLVSPGGLGKNPRFQDHIRQKYAETPGPLEFHELQQWLRPSRAVPMPTDLEQHLEKMWRNANSVLMVVRAGSLTERGNYVLLRSEMLKNRSVSYHIPFCKDMAYGKQRSADAMGSGFFVGKNIVATAAHVVLQPGTEWGDLRFVHGVRMKTDGTFRNGIKVHKSRVFKPVEAGPVSGEFHLSDLGSDFALLEVRGAYETEGIKPTTQHRSVELPDVSAYNKLFQEGHFKKEIYGMGHGLALPLKISIQGKVIHSPKTMPYFECDLQLLGGNSGSPVFDSETHELLGIYIRGTKKLGLKKDCGCLDLKTEESGNAVEGQECQRLEAVCKAREALLNRIKSRDKQFNSSSKHAKNG